MAYDMFLKIDGIEGESQDAKHKGEIQLESFSWGASNASRVSTGGGGGAGRASFQDFQFTAVTTKASPLLLQSCVSGTHHKTAVLTVRKAGEIPFDFYKVSLTNVLVSFYKDAEPNSDTAPTDDVGLVFQKLSFAVMSQTPTGVPGTANTAPATVDVTNPAAGD